MKIVIDLPDGFLTKELSNDDITLIFVAIANGTQLPKWHGDLIDRKELLKDLYKRNYTDLTYRDFVALVDYAPTIIESDKPKRKAGTPLEENDSGYNCENWIP